MTHRWPFKAILPWHISFEAGYMFRLILSIILMGSIAVASAEIRTEEVSYRGGGVEMKDFLAWDDSIEGTRPGIPLKYNALADKASWAHMQFVFAEAFAD
jgi:hypothetical protein